MTEENNELGTQVPSGDAVPATQVAEKLIPQSQVNELIGNKKLEAYQKGRMDALAEIKTPAQQTSESSNPADAQLSPDAVNKIVEQKLAEQQTLAQHQQAMGTFIQKMMNGPAKYPDFEQKIEQLNLPSLLPIVHLANSVDNSDDVMYDLANNPEKVARLLTTMDKAPHIAALEIQKLSGSIKANQIAEAQPKSVNPLSHVQPSTVGLDNGSKATTDDWRKVDWLRG